MNRKEKLMDTPNKLEEIIERLENQLEHKHFKYRSEEAGVGGIIYAIERGIEKTQQLKKIQF